MDFSWLKQILPRGLYGRAALILILPVVTIQIVVSVVFIQRHFERVTQQMTETMRREIVLVLGTIEAAPDLGTARREVAALAVPLGLAIDLPASPTVAGETTDRRYFYDLTGREVIAVLRRDLAGVRAIDLLTGSRVRIVLASQKGVMEIAFDRARVSASTPHQLLVLMLVVSLLMTVIAYLFLRNQLRPIRRMARAAEAFGKGRTIPYKPAGALEVRSAGAAFLDMRARIERQIESRTLMLSGISHDLRTPLTRLRLGLSMLPETADTRDEIAAMERDVTEMAALVDAFLEFARAEATSGEPERVDPCRFAREVVEDAQRMGRAVVLRACPETGETCLFRPDAMRRALDNLIGNAVRYGRRAEVSVVLTPRALRIVVEDDGPGIPPERREEALKPFIRLDPARNQDRGQGVGLGLSIAADILRSHGGSLKLGHSERLGGLMAEMILPR
ncbi:MAG: two-component sensor histidine kinase [Sphingomonadales bacterium]|nr:two-component sensor histidine kinase [Sphingomonadales bacterium]